MSAQVRTVSADRLTGRDPIYRLRAAQIGEVRAVPAQMIDI